LPSFTERRPRNTAESNNTFWALVKSLAICANPKRQHTYTRTHTCMEREGERDGEREEEEEEEDEGEDEGGGVGGEKEE
jgi:hypothetical protein